MKNLQELQEPQKKISVRHFATFDWNSGAYLSGWYDKIADLDKFLDWCKKTVPVGATNTSIAIDQTWDYDDCTTNLELSWDEIIDNPNYDKEMRKYDKKLSKLKKENK